MRWKTDTTNDKANIKKCVCVSMNRSGSTFFVSTLSATPKIIGDYEIQVVNDVPTPFHRSLQKFSLREIFDSIVSTKKNIAMGVSKIVIAPQHVFSFHKALPLLLKELGKIDLVVVIVRSWHEQFYSKYLGGGHLTYEKDKLPPNLRNFYIESEFFDKRFTMNRRELNLEKYIEDLSKREVIQLKLLDPICRLQNSILLEYENIHPFLKSFLREYSDLSKNQIENYVTNSPTIKLSSPPDADLFINFPEVQKIKNSWNIKYLNNISSMKRNANQVFE